MAKECDGNCRRKIIMMKYPASIDKVRYCINFIFCINEYTCYPLSTFRNHHFTPIFSAINVGSSLTESAMRSRYFKMLTKAKNVIELAELYNPPCKISANSVER